MSQSDRAAFWDNKFRAEGYLYGTRPNAFLVAESYRLTPGQRILTVGDGEGRNGVWLAEQGFSVASVDVSPRALQKAGRLALDRGVSLTTICADLTDWVWPQAEYDAVVAIFLHFRPPPRRRVHQSIAAALKPGAHLILEAFTPNQLIHHSGGPPERELMYTSAMLAEDFAGLDILELEEATTTLAEGTGHSGEAAVVRLIARRPAG